MRRAVLGSFEFDSPSYGGLWRFPNKSVGGKLFPGGMDRAGCQAEQHGCEEQHQQS